MVNYFCYEKIFKFCSLPFRGKPLQNHLQIKRNGPRLRSVLLFRVSCFEKMRDFLTFRLYTRGHL